MSEKMVGHFILKLATAAQIIMASLSTAFLEQIKNTVNEQHCDTVELSLRRQKEII